MSIIEPPLLIQILEDSLKPSLSSQSFSDSIQDGKILSPSPDQSLEDLLSQKMQTPAGENIKNALILINCTKDLPVSMKKLTEICSAYDSLLNKCPEFKSSINKSFEEVIEELGSYYNSFDEFYELSKIIDLLKKKGQDITSFQDSLYTHFSSMFHSKVCEIYDNLTESFKDIENLLKTLEFAKKIGLINENIVETAFDLVFSFIEEKIDYLRIIQDKIETVNHEESSILLSYFAKFEHENEFTIDKFDRLKAIVGIQEPPEPVAQLDQELSLPDIRYNFDLQDVIEDKRSLYSYEHLDFHVEIKRATVNQQKAIVKRYSKIDNKPWNPDKFLTEIQIFQKCSEINQNSDQGGSFLKFYGAIQTQDSVSFFVEQMDEDLAKRIQAHKETKKNFDLVEFQSIACQLIESFAILETIGIMHQDIKPGNILVSGYGENIKVKVTDFGASKFKVYGMATTLTAEAVTTEYYRAPEISRQTQATYNSFKSDAYSLGLTLYEMYFLKDIKGVNDPAKQQDLMNQLATIDHKDWLWLKNLLRKLMSDVSERLTFKQCSYFLPDRKTGA